ncbi:VOC family protein [uncultured Pseudoteredinibacter sp.]|uniref:VOC family protein n=1 Tax=uncultured Pseudoteredinibacter sp. TaxID=1641701 RepID=UPI0026282764|nr:VOC family protein [uncultured Pseudoteredinibacter sp.]
MISHTTLGSNNLSNADAFYSSWLPELHAKKIYQSEQVIFWEFYGGGAKLAISKPYDGEPASNGNGTMLALQADSVQTVDKIYHLAIDAGANCEGKPGDRNPGSFYGAYFRDLDGNKLAVFFRVPPPTDIKVKT